MKKITIKIPPGTVASWGREVGYGTPPDWYFKASSYELELNNSPDISKLLKNEREK